MEAANLRALMTYKLDTFTQWFAGRETTRGGFVRS